MNCQVFYVSHSIYVTFYYIHVTNYMSLTCLTCHNHVIKCYTADMSLFITNMSRTLCHMSYMSITSIPFYVIYTSLAICHMSQHLYMYVTLYYIYGTNYMSNVTICSISLYVTVTYMSLYVVHFTRYMLIT